MGVNIRFQPPTDGRSYAYHCYVTDPKGNMRKDVPGFVFHLLEQKQGEHIVDYKFAVQQADPGKEIEKLTEKDYVSLRKTVREYMTPEYGMDNPYKDYVKPKMARRIALDSMQGAYDKLIEWSGKSVEDRARSEFSSYNLNLVFLTELRKNSQQTYNKIATLETAQKSFEEAKQQMAEKRQLINIAGLDLSEGSEKSDPSPEV